MAPVQLPQKGDSGLSVSSGAESNSNSGPSPSVTIPIDEACSEINRSSKETSISPTTENEGLFSNPKGWAVVVCSFLVNFFTLGVLFQWGNYQQFYLQAYQGQTDTFRISFVGTMGCTLLLSSAVLLPPLIHRFGYRRTMSIGTVLAPLGLVLASFSTQLWHIYLAQGALFGLGCGFIYAPSLALPSMWFKRNRALATRISASGSGIGALVISPLNEHLIENLGYRMALRIEGVLGFVVLAAATCLAFSNSASGAVKRPPFQLLHRDLLHRDYLLLIGYCLVCYFGFFGPFFLAPQYTVFLGHSKSDGAARISLMAGMNSLSRITMGFLADRFGKINIMFFCALLAGVFTSVLWQSSSSYGAYTVFCILSGFTGGAFVSLLPVVTADVVGIENLQRGIGLCYLLTFFGNLLGSPIAGKLLEKFGWTAAIQFSGAMTLFSALLLLVLRMKRSGGRLFVKI